MTFSFTPHQGLVKVSTRLKGPAGTALLQFALDTGATTTLVNSSRLQAIGYETENALDKLQIVTGSGVELASRITLLEISALGLDRPSFAVVSHDLPPAVGVDGLLGLDFLRGRILTLDFQTGQINLK